ncbi:MAG: HD domain-containing phosphohydrolase [Planctomycetota bacterium]
MDGEIIVKLGKSKGRRFPINVGQRLTLGRGVKADIQMFDEGLSRVHCAVENRGDDFLVTDLESANGSLLNGESISSAPASSGDEITLGLVVVELAGAGSAGVAERDAEGESPVGEAKAEASPLATLLEVEEEHDSDEEAELAGTGTELMRVVDPGNTGILKLEDLHAQGRLERAHRDLVTIYRVSNAINGLSEPRELADTLAQTVADVMQAGRAAVLLKSRGGDSVDLVAEHGSGVTPGREISVSRTVVSEVVGKGVSRLSRNVQEDARYAAGESLIIQQVQSMMCAPLLAQSEVIGVLYVDSTTADAFDEQDLELLAAIGNQAGVALQRVKLLADLDNLFFSTIRSLVRAVDAKDPYTHGHSERVTAFALKLAAQLDMSRHDREIVQLAGLLHDVGKIGVPESVLHKPGELDDEEFEKMKLHPVHGAEIISNIESANVPEITTAVRHHHERWDGSGYPDGLEGEQSPLIARLLGLADAFDAMTSDRPYRKGFAMDRAVGVVRDCAGTQFDPQLAEAFAKIHERGELILPRTMALKYTTMATPKV